MSALQQAASVDPWAEKQLRRMEDDMCRLQKVNRHAVHFLKNAIEYGAFTHEVDLQKAKSVLEMLQNSILTPNADDMRRCVARSERRGRVIIYLLGVSR